MDGDLNVKDLSIDPISMIFARSTTAMGKVDDGISKIYLFTNYLCSEYMQITPYNEC